VTLAYHFLHIRAKTSGASSYLSEPPIGVGPALASRQKARGGTSRGRCQAVPPWRLPDALCFRSLH
jgi:hypothetical protein